MKKIGYIMLPLLLLLAACSPYDFKMGHKHIVRGKVLTALSTVDQDQTVTTLHDTGAIGLSYFGATQYNLSMGLRLVRGEGVRIMLRPDVEQRDVKDSGIVVTLTKSGSWLDSAQHIFSQRPDLGMPVGQYVPVYLMSENNYSQIVVGCDTVYRGWTKRMESDDVVIQ